MSRIGKLPIQLPDGVELKLEGHTVEVKGPKGTLNQRMDPSVSVSVEDKVVKLTRKSDQKAHKAYHGLYRSLLKNMIQGVSEGFKKDLQFVGVGYKASVQNNVLEMHLGFSHSIFFSVPKEVSVTAVTAKGKDPVVTVEGCDKQLVGQVAAKIRSLRKPEPYKGKGIRFVGEVIRRKAGKTAAK